MGRPKRKMVIITSYFEGETYGLLGPQLAATLIGHNSPFQCIVLGVTRGDDRVELKKALKAHFGAEHPVIGFSTLSGSEDLFHLAGELRGDGALTILAGPQAGNDFAGETGWRENPGRFPGYRAYFDYALQGPAEQILPLLQDMDGASPESISGLLFGRADGSIQKNPPAPWRSDYLRTVDWRTLYRPGSPGLVPARISGAQVLQQIGCPHASKTATVAIDPPTFMPNAPVVELPLSGCSFCDVAVDKGFCGQVEKPAVMAQIAGLPTDETGRKIPFELINENPFRGLPGLLSAVEAENLSISQINLTTRADYLVRGEPHLTEALKIARKMRIRIVCVSVGFESFDDTILRNLNKGITIEVNLEAIALMRRLKRLFPFQWGYLRHEGGNHGLIHPTPWDTPRNAAAIAAIIERYRLGEDILPAHSTPLIIHHGSGLGEWIRRIEKHTGAAFNRNGAIISWWDKDHRFAGSA